MAVSIIIGGQYGSEGKGKVAYLWAKKMKAKAAVRVGGSNSGHTVYDEDGKVFAFRMLPTACLVDDVVSILPSGSYIDVPILLKEIQVAGIMPEKLKIDPNAVIIKDEYKSEEQSMILRETIGSTLSGTGVAVIERIRRNKSNPILMAKDVEALKPFLADTKIYMRRLLADGVHVIIEGTQGYGLSNYHAKDYPYATSRDTTAAFFLAETGISPFDVEHIVMTIRAFPIRVSGNSGPLEKEIDWQTVSKESGSEKYFEEKTTVTQKIRRVARFDAKIVKEAIIANRPDIIVLNHLDYLDYSNKNIPQLTKNQKLFVEEIEEEIGRKIDYYGNGEMTVISPTVDKGELYL